MVIHYLTTTPTEKKRKIQRQMAKRLTFHVCDVDCRSAAH